MQLEETKVPADINLKIKVDAKEAIATLKEVTDVANEALEALTKLGCKIGAFPIESEVITSLKSYVTSQEAKVSDTSK
ncbi:hypothetical protein [Bacillus cereus group sp. BfR-BA-01328]|uniref:hypothetical protein n=1 Tax=Bacillus cereus group sp. BfR-BA-01328 TaxID=2920304 RepID=UPI001F5A563C